MSDKKDDLVVVKDNHIINSSYKLTLVEQRIILGCISKIDSTEQFTEEDGFTIRVSEIKDLTTDENMKSLYNQIKQGTNRLYERSIKLNDDDTDVVRWIYRKRYNDDEGSVTLYFTKTVLPYLTQLRGNFTKYKLQYVSRFKSTHSIRIYELLCQWSFVGQKEIEVDELKRLLGVADKYERTSNFLSRVVDISVKEINKFSNIKLKCGYRKTGRRITHIQFDFNFKKTKKKPEKTPEKLTMDEMLRFVRENEKLTRGKSEYEIRKQMEKSKS